MHWIRLLAAIGLLGCSTAPVAPPGQGDDPAWARLEVPELIGARLRADIDVNLAPEGSCDGGAEASVVFFSSDVPVLTWRFEAAAAVRWSLNSEPLGEASASNRSHHLLPPGRYLEPGLHPLCVRAFGDDGGEVAAASVSLNVAPPIYTQIGVAEVGWNGMLARTSASHRVHRGRGPLTESRWISSDFALTHAVRDERGADLTLEVEHDAKRRIHQYRAALKRHVAPGNLLVLITHSTDDGSRVTQPAPGVFEYEMRHSPNSGVPTRSYSLHILPEGAKVVDASDGLVVRQRNGRAEIVSLLVVPAGGSKHTRYRYQMPGATEPPP